MLSKPSAGALAAPRAHMMQSHFTNLYPPRSGDRNFYPVGLAVSFVVRVQNRWQKICKVRGADVGEFRPYPVRIGQD